jgi:hypothetical protein
MDLDRQIAILACILAFVPAVLCGSDDTDPIAEAVGSSRVVIEEVAQPAAPTVHDAESARVVREAVGAELR